MIGSMWHIIHEATRHFHHTTTIWGHMQHFDKMSFFYNRKMCETLLPHDILSPRLHVWYGRSILKLFWA